MDRGVFDETVSNMKQVTTMMHVVIFHVPQTLTAIIQKTVTLMKMSKVRICKELKKLLLFLLDERIISDICREGQVELLKWDGPPP